MLATKKKRAEIAKGDLRVAIRWMIRRDMPEVLAIEQDCFESPWGDEDFIHCRRERNCIGMVAEYGEQIVGYMIYELHKTRLHIINFAVSKDARCQGVGRQMIKKLTEKLSSERRQRITLQVSEMNLPGQLFFQHMGFWATTVLNNYYDNHNISAYEMEIWYSD